MNLHWIKIYDSEEALQNNIPKGRAEAFVLKGKKICVAQGNDGFYAVSDRCPHNGASLSKGVCNGDHIVCPMHRYPFDLKTGKAAAGLSYALETYPIQITPQGVFVGIKPKWWEM